jgi:hypothetical protein
MSSGRSFNLSKQSYFGKNNASENYEIAEKINMKIKLKKNDPVEETIAEEDSQRDTENLKVAEYIEFSGAENNPF